MYYIYICDGFDGNIQVDISWDMTGTIFFFWLCLKIEGKMVPQSHFQGGKPCLETIGLQRTGCLLDPGGWKRQELPAKSTGQSTRHILHSQHTFPQETGERISRKVE